jgi:hypothetical protein
VSRGFESASCAQYASEVDFPDDCWVRVVACWRLSPDRHGSSSLLPGRLIDAGLSQQYLLNSLTVWQWHLSEQLIQQYRNRLAEPRYAQ